MATRSSNISQVAMKAMGLLGSIQVVTILCSIVRTKLVALWIGPVGVALFGIFNQALETINTATNLGIRQSSVRDIAQACERHDASRVQLVIAVVRRWSRWLGVLGAVVTIALAPALSRWTFSNGSHTWNFIALAVAVLLVALTNGEQAIMQGMSRLKRLASISLWGNLCGLLASIPLFYLLRERSIVPSIIAYAASCAIFAIALGRRASGNKPKATSAITARQVFNTGKGFVKLGIYMTAGSFVSLLVTYVFLAWLRHQAGDVTVGYYQAGYTLVNKYTGLALTALGLEFFPRLSRVASSRLRTSVFVSQEINLGMMVMAPVVATFLLLRQPVVALLYSHEFMTVIPLISIGIIGTIFRTVAWSMAFVILARGSGLTYLITESVDSFVGLLLNIACYRYMGLAGLGVAYVLWYALYAVMIGIIYRCHYRLRISRGAVLNVAAVTLLSLAMLAVMYKGWIVAAATLAAAIVAASLVAIKRQWRR